jgi:RNA polymerase sigma factor (sigma-70 family)
MTETPLRGADQARLWAAVSAERARLLSLARTRVPDEADAEDCAHEAMVRAMEFANLDEARLPQFLTTVTIRLCTDHHRGRVRRDRAGRRVALRDTAAAGPEETVCERSEAEWLAGHVDALPESQRAVVAARAEGLSCLGVAERLGVPETTVESALARARRSLRRALESSWGLAPWARRALFAGGTATVSALALLTLPHATPPAPAARARLAAVPRPGGRTPSTRAAGRTSVPRLAAPGAVVATATAGANHGAAAGPAYPPHDGGGDYAGGAALPGGRGGGIEQKDPRQPPPPPDQRVEQCLEYGVYVAPRADCGYPPGDPRNDRYPDDSIVVRPPHPRPETP